MPLRPSRAAPPAAILLGTLAILGSACGGAPTRDAVRTVVIAADGLEWNVVLPLLEEGQLPNLAAMMEGGSYGLLETLEPTSSPVIWTTIATGKPPEEHGIVGFLKPDHTLYQSSDRRTKAIWNILGDYGRRTCVVGWWMTYPVEAIDGAMVAQTNTVPPPTGIAKGRLRPDLPRQVHPPEREAEMMQILAESEAGLEAFGEAHFHHFGEGMPFLWQKARWALRADSCYRQIALGLARESPGCDLLMLYVGLPDVIGHYFWMFHRPDRFGRRPPDEYVELLGSAVPDAYAFVDDLVGELRASVGDAANLVVLSDHGMRARMSEKLLLDLAGVTGHHPHAPPGLIVADGPDFRARGAELPTERSELPRAGSVMDVAPTLLALYGIPAGEDMPGEPLRGWLTEPARVPRERVPTHDTPDFVVPVAPRREGEAERIEQLRQLGYLEPDADADAEPRPDDADVAE